MKTHIKWYDAAGKLIRTDEVEGNAQHVAYDPEAGGWLPMAPPAPYDAAFARLWPVFEEGA